MPSVQIPAVADCGGVTEIRVHGVGGSPPEAILGDLAPEQVSGDAIAGFYRTSDHSPNDMGPDTGRHVEVYSWGGLTSRSKVRVLWLALLPFLFANLAGWMCSARTRGSVWRFRLHRLAGGLGGLALTVNAALVAVLISADAVAYQTSRANLARHQWWLKPLGWTSIAGHPARQVMLGVLVPALLVLALAGLAGRTWRYEAVRPPYRVTSGRRTGVRMITAAALPKGLADDEFWDGEGSVRQLTWVHVSVVAGFLAMVLGVTTRALAAGSPHATDLGRFAIGVGAATVALGAGYIGLDALDVLPGRLRGRAAYLLAPALIALVSAGVFAWRQPGGKPGRALELPGMAAVAGWTVLAIAAVAAVALVSMLFGLGGSRGTLIGGSWLTLMLAFSALNTVMLGAGIWVAHLVGPVTSNATQPGSQGMIYLPPAITSGVPLVVWAAVLAILAVGLVEAGRWLRTRELPAATIGAYQEQAAGFRDPLAEPRKYWYWSGLSPFPPPGDTSGDPGGGKNWERTIARTQFLGRAPHDATWLLWTIIGAQLVMAVCAWRLRFQPPPLIRYAGVSVAGLVLPALMAFLYSAWNNPTRRRTIGVLWDVGTFWPRSYHPLSPPCYTERAIPELQRRMWWLHDNGGRVLLVAHSQGAVLATAALVQSGCRPAADQPALITFGSPVCKLYSWGFPAYFDPALLEPLRPGGQARLCDWHNFYYPTDPIGGSMARDLPGGDQVDTELLDPAESYYLYGQAPPAPKGHSGYWADARVWNQIDGVAAGLPGAPGQGDVPSALVPAPGRPL